jgi:hypothetical protein
LLAALVLAALVLAALVLLIGILATLLLLVGTLPTALLLLARTRIARLLAGILVGVVRIGHYRLLEGLVTPRPTWSTPEDRKSSQPAPRKYAAVFVRFDPKNTDFGEWNMPTIRASS